MAAIALQVSISYGLSLLANKLLVKKDKSIRDDRPTPLAQRGAMIPYLAGRRRVAPHFLLAKHRNTRSESLNGSKGKGSSGNTRVYYEDAIHALNVGVSTRLHAVRQNGKVIFRGPIDSVLFPSGSAIDTGIEGEFTIWWGETTQDIDPQSQDTLNGMGIASRWPLVTRMGWLQKRLGPSPNWSLMDVEMERRVQSQLTASSPWIEATRSLNPNSFPILAVTNGQVGTAAIVIATDQTPLFKNGGMMKIAANTGIADGDYPVLGSTYIARIQNPDGSYTPIDRTTILVAVPLVGATATGTTTPYIDDPNDGANPAHVIWEKLFAPWPHGRELDQSEFNMASLEEIGAMAAEERIPVNVLTQDGDSVRGTVGAIMQDLGITVALERDGLATFRPVRFVESAGLPILVSDMIVRPMPQVDNSIESVDQPTRTVFIFPDRTRGYRDMPIKIDDDGNASVEESAGIRTRRVAINTVTEFEAASRVAERRSQEDMPGAAVYRIFSTREARLLPISQVFLSAGTTTTGAAAKLRLIGKKIDTRSGRVELRALPDFYGQTASEWVGDDGDLPPGSNDPKPDEAFTQLEVPAHVLAGVGIRDSQAIVVPRIRAHGNIVGADLWISRDGSTYTMVGHEDAFITGGILQAAMPAGGSSILDPGPEIEALGPDIATVLDLTSDPINWRSGRMVALIDDPVNGQEICFVKKATAIGANHYTLDGMIRARFDTNKVAHPAGLAIYVFQQSTLELIRDTLLAPNVSLFVKSQPRTADGSVPLNHVNEVVRMLTGKGVVPMAPLNFRTSNNSNTYRTGQNVVFKWAYRSVISPHTGAGAQGAGAPTGSSPPDGEFVIRIATNLGVIVREIVGITVPTFTYQNAQLIADFGFETTILRATIFAVKAGYISPSIEIVITKV